MKQVGVYSFDDIMARCWVDDVTQCWHWRMGRNGAGAPCLWVPGLGRNTTLGTAICFLTTGKPPAPGKVWHPKCSTPNCGNPGHYVCGTRSTQMLAAKIVRTPTQRAHVAAGKRALSAITDEQVASIRNDSRRLVDIAAEHGISVSHVSNIRRGAARRPLAAPGASAFNWSPTP